MLARLIGGLVPFAIARINEFQFITILMHRGESPSVADQTEIPEKFGQTDRSENPIGRRQSL